MRVPHRLRDCGSLLRLNLQKDFHSVSTRMNCRLIMTSRMAYRQGAEPGSDLLVPATVSASTRVLSGAHLTVLPVQALEGLDVLQLDPLRQPVAPKVHLPEAGQRAGGI